MILLAMDTSTRRASLALVGRDGALLVAEPDPDRRHGRGLIPAVGELLARGGVKVGDLEGLAVGLGPGSYTGLRVGVTAAKTLAYAAGRPLVGFDSLEAIASGAPPEAIRLAVAVDAQRGDLFVAEFRRDAPAALPRRLSPTRIEPAARWLASLEPGTLVLGPDLDRLAALMPDSVRWAGAEFGYPRGEAFAGLARQSMAAGPLADPWSLEPVYLRRSAAEDQWDAPNRVRTR